MKFEYSGRQAGGEKASGVIEATSVNAAVAELRRQNILPVRVEPTREDGNSGSQSLLNMKIRLPGSAPSVSLDDQILFCRQMFALSRSGIPLLRAINGLTETNRSEAMKEILRDVYQTLQGGSELSSALAKHRTFDALFISMIRVGETTGRIDLAFQQLIRHLELEKTTRKQVKSTLRYPTMVVSAIGIAMAIINWMVIPSFAKVFSKMGAELPLATRILMYSSDFSVRYWWLIAGIIVVSLLTFRYWKKTEQGGLIWDRIKLRIPVIGPLTEKITVVRFTQPFAMMLSAGVPLLQSLNVSSRTVGNRYIAERIQAMASTIERGDNLLNSAAASGMFNPLVLQMIAVGEESGRVHEMLEDVSEFYQQEIEYDLKKLAENIEPLLLIVMGIMVLVLALGVFLPMWDMSSVAR